MSSDLWNIQKHIIPASHIRGAPRVVRSEGSPYLKQALNQYTPKHNAQMHQAEGAVTIILIHGINMSKESFEPFLDDLLTASGDTLPIRSIWAPESTFNGESLTINKDNVGDMVHLHDFARDILHMINHFQTAMPPPLVGAGFSIGCGALSLISSFHPRLFSGILFLEPSIGPKPGRGYPVPPKYFPGVAVTRRKDAFTSREHAHAYLRKTDFSKRFDERVLEKLLDYEFRPMKASERQRHSNPSIQQAPQPLTWVVPNHVASYAWMVAYPPLEGYPTTIEHAMPLELTAGQFGFFSPYAVAMLRNLLYIAVPVLVLFSRNSLVTRNPVDRKYILDRIGTGDAGNGGVAAGMVEEVWVEDATHPVMLEKPAETAKALLPWLTKLKASLDAERENRKHEPPFQDGFPKEWLDRISKL